jgi:hypothetical protein
MEGEKKGKEKKQDVGGRTETQYRTFLGLAQTEYHGLRIQHRWIRSNHQVPLDFLSRSRSNERTWAADPAPLQDSHEQILSSEDSHEP